MTVSERSTLTDNELLVELYQRGLWPPEILEDLSIGTGDDTLILHANERIAEWRGRLHYLTPTTWTVLGLLVERYPFGISSTDLVRTIWPLTNKVNAIASLRVVLRDIRLLMPRIIAASPTNGSNYAVYSLDLSSREAYDTPRRRRFTLVDRAWHIATVNTRFGPAQAILHHDTEYREKRRQERKCDASLD